METATTLAGRHAPAVKRLVPPSQRTRAWEAFFRVLPRAGKRATFARWFRGAAGACRRQGSPLYGDLLEVAAADIEAGGPCWDVVETYHSEGGVPPAATALAFMAAVHHVVLDGRGAALAPHYPSVGGTAGQPGAGPALLQVVRENVAELRTLLRRPVQTNEVARSRVLIGGFLVAAQASELPLRVLEFGASAGLNLRWDHFRYEIGDAAWGDPASPLRLVDGYREGRPPLHLDATVAERRGSDLHPIDPRTPEGRNTLLSHVWADQLERIERLRGAFAVAAQVDAPVERADAAAWVEAEMRALPAGVHTVIYDTCMMEYLPPAARERIATLIAAAGERASAERPLSWLHLAPTERKGVEELHLTSWPGERHRLLATCDPHAREARWID